MDWIFWTCMAALIVSGVGLARGIANGDWESGFTSDTYNADGTKKDEGDGR